MSLIASIGHSSAKLQGETASLALSEGNKTHLVAQLKLVFVRIKQKRYSMLIGETGRQTGYTRLAVSSCFQRVVSICLSNSQQERQKANFPEVRAISLSPELYASIMIHIFVSAGLFVSQVEAWELGRHGWIFLWWTAPMFGVCLYGQWFFTRPSSLLGKCHLHCRLYLLLRELPHG